jgi:hypothetical protein
MQARWAGVLVVVAVLAGLAGYFAAAKMRVYHRSAARFERQMLEDLPAYPETTVVDQNNTWGFASYDDPPFGTKYWATVEKQLVLDVSLLVASKDLPKKGYAAALQDDMRKYYLAILDERGVLDVGGEFGLTRGPRSAVWMTSEEKSSGPALHLVLHFSIFANGFTDKAGL